MLVFEELGLDVLQVGGDVRVAGCRFEQRTGGGEKEEKNEWATRDGTHDAVCGMYMYQYVYIFWEQAGKRSIESLVEEKKRTLDFQAECTLRAKKGVLFSQNFQRSGTNRM